MPACLNSFLKLSTLPKSEVILFSNLEGILPGGGTALVRSISSIKKCEIKGDDSFNAGLRIVEHACEAPLRQIVLNTGGAPEVVLERVTKAKAGKGYNARSKTYCDLVT